MDSGFLCSGYIMYTTLQSAKCLKSTIILINANNRYGTSLQTKCVRLCLEIQILQTPRTGCTLPFVFKFSFVNCSFLNISHSVNAIGVAGSSIYMCQNLSRI